MRASGLLDTLSAQEKRMQEVAYLGSGQGQKCDLGPGLVGNWAFHCRPVLPLRACLRW